MTRKTAREIAVRLSFAASAAGLQAEELLESFFEPEHYATLAAEDEVFSEYPDDRQMDYIRRLILLSDEHRDEIDGHIQSYAKGWKLDRISRTALALLRCALCEILFMEDIPDSAAINEAVELDKSFDEPDTVAFLNGVLGGFMRGERGASSEAEPVPENEPETAPVPETEDASE